ncbi:transporter [Streptomyces agglomeratus]|uniref:MDR family MFS transporter n=1 Tax=Streptomyces agglomeratus TaxID=285458 RepID=UPI0008541A25|nr:MFS transporter [Streptomyces agglomeratus]OEJ41655.1 transporter [Streptomyces agglomeratus]OEJ43966.1 transporter [Streptomyces agglomeratus]
MSAQPRQQLPRGFWWLWASTLVNRAGLFVLPFLTLYLTVERGYSATTAGVMVALYSLGGILGSLAGGSLTDRWGRRPTMLTGQLGAAAFTLGLGFAEHLAMIALLMTALGVTLKMSQPAMGAMLADIVPAEARPRAYSLNYWALNLGFSVSALSAGALATFGYVTLYVVDAATTLLCALLVFLKLPETRPEKPPATARAPEAPRASMATVLRDRRFMCLVGLNLLVVMVFTQRHVALPLSTAEAGLSTTEYGTVAAVNGVMIVTLQLLVTRYTRIRLAHRVLGAGALLVGASAVLNATADTLLLFCLAAVVYTLSEIVYVPTSEAQVPAMAPAHARGRYEGVMVLSWSVGGFVAPLTSGVVIDAYGTDALWAVCTVFGVLAALGYVALFRTRAPRDTAPPPVRTVPQE